MLHHLYICQIYLLTGGNSSGSGTSYPAVNTLNPEIERPDGEDPLKFSEFYSYEQNVTLTAFDYVFDETSSNDACSGCKPLGPFYHNDVNNLYPDALDGTYTAYENTSGSIKASTGYYQIYASGGSSTGKYIQVGSEGSIIGGGTC